MARLAAGLLAALLTVAPPSRAAPARITLQFQDVVVAMSGAKVHAQGKVIDADDEATGRLLETCRLEVENPSFGVNFVKDFSVVVGNNFSVKSRNVPQVGSYGWRVACAPPEGGDPIVANGDIDYGGDDDDDDDGDDPTGTLSIRKLKIKDGKRKDAGEQIEFTYKLRSTDSSDNDRKVPVAHALDGVVFEQTEVTPGSTVTASTVAPLEGGTYSLGVSVDGSDDPATTPVIVAPDPDPFVTCDSLTPTSVVTTPGDLVNFVASFTRTPSIPLAVSMSFDCSGAASCTSAGSHTNSDYFPAGSSNFDALFSWTWLGDALPVGISTINAVIAQDGLLAACSQLITVDIRTGDTDFFPANPNVTPKKPSVDDVISLSSRLKSTGTADATELSVSLRVDGDLLETKSYSANDKIEFEIAPNTLDAGLRDFTITVDDDGIVSESKEANNAKTRQVEVGDSASEADLRVESFSASVEGTDVTFAGRVCSDTLVGATLRLWFDLAQSPSCATTRAPSRESAITLGAGGCSDFQLAPITFVAGTYKSYLFADATCSIAETDEGNNIAKKKFRVRNNARSRRR